ncbi:N-acetyl-1-D-myo-inositol-2-amino-2-deoxy-alpha-D-glucopyranoside deacetylase [Kineosphaera limosa]|uniref:N-acetyl-1-D-myo-inositol-2-amino-2-deoxy-alpha-D-glucopyranoside deacetylase n=1 Tax=Kineosphaera limosa NBRC 100340 TaxID=1184609 RepID=K6W9Z5_9MICO|nr:N-acetyl-1-D-myo-inositol-2-amino-2-deoxy-alpha-D-glucopyranoside deacetylase [Kineosphaera limosa]NYE02450.1 N-acetyl-1-D-myo-inositol-2-amino-2-deoxy-alpha-D-glucopyranoside deacetylase [Kineosphaera limosa]GAB96025.1 N-acetyl-1-D-myo-Inosityl-2-amino-2-deoxy-alpha-D-glucopyranoside deacetylase MshB [Kineosphaera limosa NBRC 100340]
MNTPSLRPDADPVLRYLFVHAHPDDETLATGVALATLARAGHEVHVLTCTLGEEGEVIPPELAHLAADADDTLGPYRRGELRAAMSHLGVREHVLGEDPATHTGSAYRDSGMADTPANADPRSWVAADEAEAVAALREHMSDLAPDVVVTYDEHGGYLHPDHVTTHRRTRAAVAALPAQQRPRLYVVLSAQDEAAADRAWLPDVVDAAHGLTLLAAGEAYPPSVVDPALVTHEIVGDPADLAARDAALREHRTQVSVYDGGYYALSNDIAARLARADRFAALDPDTGALLPAPMAAEGAATLCEGRIVGLPAEGGR